MVVPGLSLGQPERRLATDGPQRALDLALQPAGDRRLGIEEPDHGRIRPDHARQAQRDPTPVLRVARLRDLPAAGNDAQQDVRVADRGEHLRAPRIDASGARGCSCRRPGADR